MCCPATRSGPYPTTRRRACHVHAGSTRLETHGSSACPHDRLQCLQTSVRSLHRGATFPRTTVALRPPSWCPLDCRWDVGRANALILPDASPVSVESGALMNAVKSPSGQHVRHPHSFFIGGKWVQPSTTNTLSIVSPVTEEVIATYAEAVPQDVDRAVAAAREAFDHGPWPRLSQVERGKQLLKVAEIMKARNAELAEIWTAQVGAPISLTRYAVAQGAGLFDFY